jgi:signal peptide peptidase SppA
VPEPLILPAFPRVSDFAGLWSIEPTAAAALQARARSTDWAAHLEAFNADPRPRAAMQLLPAGGGKSVAVVRLDGTLMKAASSFGGTSTVQARRDLRAAVADPDVKGVLLAIDSPGGTVSGTDDLAAEVKAANAEKPVFAFVSDLCASAAYWVASQAEAIYANSETAWVGAIGTFLALTDESKAAEKLGVEAVVFRTGPLKGSGAAFGDPLTEDQRNHFQSLVEKSQQTFDAAVRKGRDLTETQLAAVRTGGVFTASEAVDRKLIDGVQSLDKTVAALVKAANSRTRSNSGRQSAVNPQGAPMPKPTAEGDVIELTEATAGTNKPDGFATVAETRAALQAETKRIYGIQKLAANHPGIADKAIEEGWSLERTENAVLRADLPKPPAAGNPNGGRFTDIDAHARTAALAMSLGVKEEIAAQGIPEADAEQAMNMAQSGDLRGYSLHALMADVIQAAGMNHRGNRKTDGFARTALEADRALKLQASGSGFTSISLSGILGNVANKALLNAYTAVNVVWRMIAAVRSHSDFKTVTRYRLDSTGALKKVGQDGEIKHVGLDSAGYTSKLDTYAAMLALTRQMMINDDLGAFTSLPAFMGRMAALRIEELVFGLILANTGSFFAGGNNNLLTGGGSVLDDTGAALDAAETAFLNMVDVNGKPVLTTPQILLVPTALKPVATRLYNGGALITGATTTRIAANTFVGKYPPVVSPYLSNTALRDQDGVAFSGQSATAHYLFADPNDRAAIGVAFLNGQQQPTIESAETDFNTLGQQWRIYHDFGAGFEDPTGAVKSAGA